MTPPKKATDEMADAVWLRTISRAAMLAAPVVLAIGGWVTATYFNAIIDRIDRLVLGDVDNGKKLQNLGDRTGALEVTVRDLAQQSYRPTDAARDLALQSQKNIEQDRRLDMHDQRLMTVEGRVLTIEQAR